jgi:hypothetical protein
MTDASDINASENANRLGGVSIRDFFVRVGRRWFLLLAFVLASLAISTVIVRTWPLGYQARATLIQSDTLGTSGLSLMPGIGGLLGGSSGAADELEAVLKSRRLASMLAMDHGLTVATARMFPQRPPTLLEQIKSFVWTGIFRLPQQLPPDLATRIEASMDGGVEITQTGKIINVSYVGGDPAATGRILKAALSTSQQIVVERQRLQASEYQSYLIAELSNDKQQETVRVISQLLPGVISTVTRLSGPKAEAYGIIDDVYVNPIPVRPRVALVVAVCLALGVLGFCLLNVVKSVDYR